VGNFETAQRKRNITVGVFVLFAFVAISWLIYKFEDLPVEVGKLRSYQVIVQFPMAQGVQRNTPVRFCGYQIGRVTEVKRPEVIKDMKTGQFYHQTVVIISIEKEYDNIPADIQVKLMTRGLGSSYIELKTKPFDPNENGGDFLVAGSKLQGAAGVTSEFFPEESQKQLDELAKSFKRLVDNANDILGDDTNKENLKQTLANLRDATKQASSSLEEFQRFAVAGTDTLKKTDTRLDKVTVALVDTGSELGKASAQLRLILEKINRGQGTAGRLINDGKLYENLLENTQQLELLIEELRLFVAEVPDRGIPIKFK